MTPRLRVLAGSDPSSLQDITSLVNSGSSHTVTSDAFEGQVAIYIKDFPGDLASTQAAEAYFSSSERKGVTWSIQSRGRFLQPHDADAVLFGNTFERPLNLPWGSGAALKLMSYVDPTLEQDLNSKTKPWALSPLAATMPHLSVHQSSVESKFPSDKPIDEVDTVLKSESGPFKDADARRSYFRSEKARRSTSFGPEHVITTDFCYGYLSFHPSLALKLPGGISIDLQSHWDGQQVRFVCCERKTASDDKPWGRVFWCLAIEPVDPNAVNAPASTKGASTSSTDID